LAFNQDIPDNLKKEAHDYLDLEYIKKSGIKIPKSTKFSRHLRFFIIDNIPHIKDP